MSQENDPFKDLIETPKEHSIEEGKALLRDVREKELIYTEKKKASSEANADFVAAKEKFISFLKSANLDRFDGDDEFSGFTMYDELRFRVPQDLKHKADFLKFLKSEKVSSLLGQESADIFLSYVTVNAATLNKLAKELTELAAENGEALEIPGLLPPKAESKLRSLPKRKKK